MCILAGMVDVEWHQLDLRYERLRCVDRGLEARLSASLTELGQRSPVMALSRAPHVVVDGFKRIRCLRKLGHDRVSALLWDLGEAEALLLQHQQQSGHSALEEGWLLLELATQSGLSESELAAKLGRSKSWVSRRLGLVADLPVAVQELVRSGRLQPYGAGRYLLPLARANGPHAEQLAQWIATRDLSTRDLERLYRAYQASSAQSREFLVANPLVVLRAAEQTQVAPEPHWVRDAVVVERLASRILNGLRGGEGVLIPTEKARLRRRLVDAAERVSACIKECDHAGAGAVGGGVDAEGARAGDAGDCALASGEPQHGQAVPDERQPGTGERREAARPEGP